MGLWIWRMGNYSVVEKNVIVTFAKLTPMRGEQKVTGCHFYLFFLYILPERRKKKHVASSRKDRTRTSFKSQDQSVTRGCFTCALFKYPLRFFIKVLFCILSLKRKKNKTFIIMCKDKDRNRAKG